MVVIQRWAINTGLRVHLYGRICSLNQKHRLNLILGGTDHEKMVDFLKMQSNIQEKEEGK